ncbi:hypothetical protein BDP55DRAFT_674798 [Colletotrichum godetiae]|uniref:Uncharacterized protein n=1 Tax=Colletotrichum godetiae TaxID=1209918 RepID=A0AAJ0ES56_9PEZI|nr:uncharacterized protein BDP55DRAFT_674798 [Colletotrichum godetiae]KAK1671993.1 hypothetical protein BDP55DRAFT_674798 [Colletotrichum godetiae]
MDPNSNQGPGLALSLYLLRGWSAGCLDEYRCMLTASLGMYVCIWSTYRFSAKRPGNWRSYCILPSRNEGKHPR